MGAADCAELAVWIDGFMNTNLLFILAALVVLWFIVRSLRSRSNCPESALNLDDLLLGEDGKASKAATVMFGAFVVTTGIMIWLTYKGLMSEGYLVIYVGAWIAPTVTRLIVNPQPPGTVAAGPPQATTTKIETTVQTSADP